MKKIIYSINRMAFGLEKNIIGKFISVFEQNSKVDKAIIFGSRAKGNYRPDSDIDIAIKGQDITTNDIIKMSIAFEEKGITQKADLINYYSIKEPLLTEHIDRVGIELFSRWKEVKLGDVVEINKNSLSKNYPFEEIEYLDTGSITRGKIESLQPYKLKAAPSRAKRLVSNNDIIYSTVRPIQRHYGFIEKKKENLVVSTGFAVISAIEGKANPKFLYHLLSSDDVVNYLDTVAEGSTSAYPSLRPEDLALLDIVLPPIKEQKAIEEILSGLDDKIDVLHRQNKTLEQLAETLFKQWFIEEAESQSEKQLLLGDLIESVSITHSFPSDKIVFLNTSDIYLGDVLVHEPVDVKSLPGQAKKTIQKHDILFSEIRPANRRWAYVNFDADNYVVSTKLMVLRSKNILSQAFIYFYLTNPQTVDWLQLLAESRSGTFPQITFDQLKDLKINIPSDSILNDSVKWCETAIEKIKSNSTQIQTLSKLRDTLLPKLMSGEVKVKIN